MSVYSVNVYPSSTTIKTGNWYYGAYAIVNASSNCCTDVEWYSDSPSVASVNKSYGYIYGISPGTAKIYAISTVDSSKKDYITVKVTSGTICVDSVTLNRSSVSLEKGDKLTLSATVCPTNASNKSISWSSTNPSVATVSGGVVTAKARGWTYIFAEAQDGSGEYDSCYVNVTEDILVTSVTVSPSSKTMNIGDSTYLYETVCPTNATNKCVKWSSNRTSVATVNPDTGLVIAQGTGTATITATATDGSEKYGECTITVNPPIAVTGIEVCPTCLTMNVGDVECLCKEITPSNATNQTVTWCSSNENVATVGLYTGKVTAKKAGTTTITATTVDGEFTACCAVTVAGYSAIVSGRKVTVCGEDDELLDDYTGEQPIGLYVYANDMLLTSAREECDGDITVCMGEIVQALCTDNHLNPTLTEWYVCTSHKDLKIFREKTYYISELGMCPFDNINDRISLKKFIEDMGYTSKYSSISCSNGTKVIFIQGHDWYSAANLSLFSITEFASLTLSLLPFIGDIKDFVEGVAGKDIITGETLSTFDRVLCIGCTLLPVVNGATVRVGRKGFAKLDNVIKYMDDLSDAQKVILHSDIWNILRPATRGLVLEAEFANTVYKSSKGWYHIGKEMNGFFPVNYFAKNAEKIEDISVVSMKTLDPRLYKLADESYNITRIKNVINTYTDKLRKVDIFVDGVPISQRQLDLVVPKGYATIINNIKDIDKDNIIFNLIEL